MTDMPYEHSLVIFDNQDLDNPRERRMAVYALNDYYGSVLAEVGGGALDFWPRDLEKGIKHQWKKAKSRINELDDGNIPGKFNTAIESVNEIRNDISHDFEEIPPKDILEQSRELAPQWKDWILEVSEDYEQHQESLTATEALKQVGMRTLDDIQDQPQNYSFGLDNQQESLNEDVTQLRTELEGVSDEDSVTRELVNVISEIMELERDKDSLESEHRMREEEARRREETRRAENTMRVIVTEPVDDFGQITFVRHEVGKPDETYVVNVHHAKTPEEVRENLMDLEADDEVRFLVEESMSRDKNGRIETTPYIADIR
ncbi:hypothetical protein JZX76_11560 [Haloarcula hispanica]|uniref:Uncharacterized protein n=1 Tax=Haloarcula hispanica TaxID=51589 RepID=A0A482T832_HALHI|nr:hypothetical protein [Haloarcula hispanica]MCJ0620124.1 hypothetical protein [Haloarcula hispanica]RYJ10552.1 hypothetical protein ELS20_11475 [Haloarcula hispanica]